MFEFASKDDIDQNLDEIIEGHDLLGLQLNLKKKGKTLSTLCFPLLIEAMTFVTFDVTQDGKKHPQKKHQKKDNNEKTILAFESSIVNYIHDSIW